MSGSEALLFSGKDLVLDYFFSYTRCTTGRENPGINAPPCLPKWRNTAAFCVGATAHPTNRYGGRRAR
jgi:hypothetical protein